LLVYPAEQLEAQRKHAHNYLTFAELADSHLQGKEQITWYGRLDEEIENLRIALNFFEANEYMTEALNLATSLGYFWDIRGYYAEGTHHLKLILAKTTGHSVTRVKALMRMGDLVSAHGEHQQARHCYEQSLEGAKALNEPSLQAQALLGLGSIAKQNRGELNNAKVHFQAALELAGADGNKSLEAYALRLLGGISSDQGDYVGAKTYYETAIRLYETLGSLHDRAKCSINLSTVLSYLGDSKQAHTMSREALELFRTIGDKYGMGIALLNLGWTAEERDWHTTIAYYEESLQLYRTLGDKHMMSHLLNNLAGQWQKHKEPYKAKLLLEESLAIRQILGPGTLTNQALLILGQVQHDLGNDREARQTYDACITLCRDHQDNWALMRVLEVSARLYLQNQNHKAAERELTEAFELAERAGDKNTLQKILETQAALRG
jgi:tetratricopeptide (TPR) repeat protein